MLGILFAARVFEVGKGHIGADKNIVTNAQTVPQLHVTFDSDAVANDNVELNQAVLANITVFAYLVTGLHNDELPDARACANGGGLNLSQGVDKGLRHG